MGKGVGESTLGLAKFRLPAYLIPNFPNLATMNVINSVKVSLTLRLFMVNLNKEVKLKFLIFFNFHAVKCFVCNIHVSISHILPLPMNLNKNEKSYFQPSCINIYTWAVVVGECDASLCATNWQMII